MKKHILVIEINGNQTEVELKKPFSKDNREVMDKIDQHLAMGWYGDFSSASEKSSSYEGWAKATIYIGGRTDYTDEDEDGDETWVNDPWDKEEVSND